MKQDSLTPEFVEFMPRALDSGIVYVSMTYATTAHLCACGCGNKVVLPLHPAQWHLSYDGDCLNLEPSVGNWEFPCRSHYWIRENRIVWDRRWSRKQVDERQHRDAADLDAYFSDAPSNGSADVFLSIRNSSLARLLTRWLRRE